MVSRKLLVTSMALLFASAAFPQSKKTIRERKLYYGSDSSEARMWFDGVVEIEGPRTPTMGAMRKYVDSQIEHTIGPMSSAKFMAVPKGDHIVSEVKILDQEGMVTKVGYKYTGTIVVKNGPKDKYDLIMPINTAKIYRAGFVGSHNPCTDHHYQSEGDFWYFWSPYLEGCKLEEGKHYQVVKANIARFPNTKLSYPEYHNLIDDNGMVTVHMLFGLDDPKKSRDPLKSTDVNASIFRDFRAHLKKNKYTSKKWSTSEVENIALSADGKLPYVETFTKGKIQYRLFFGATGIDEDSLAFHWFYKDALENASIMLYGGHSGLGGHLDLPSIEGNLGTKINFNTKRYQIFFFDSCTSYKYYNNIYFERKMTKQDEKGTKKLDIFTNGLATYFHTMPTSNRAIFFALEKAVNMAQNGSFVSYQTLAKQIDSDNLFGVNGDEDNETPRSIK